MKQEVVYADFECSTDGTHKPYCICWMKTDEANGWFYGSDCAIKFLEVMNHNFLIFFHN